MTNTEILTFLRELWCKGVELWLESDQLRFRANKDVLTTEHLGLLRENKAEIISILHETPDAYLGFPLSQGQKSIYMQQSLAPNSGAYHLSALLELNPQLDIECLKKSLDLVLQRHAPLRMGIKTLDGELAQQVSYSLPSILTHETIETLDDIELWAKGHAEKPFDLENDALVRAALLQTHHQENRLLVIVHHIVADFWALSLMLNELEAVYTSTLSDLKPNLPPIGKLYKDYVTHESQWINSQAGDLAKHYWHNLLSPLPKTIQIHTDFPRPLHASHQGNELQISISHALTHRINEEAQNHGTSAFIWILSCYQLLLHYYSGETHFSIGSPLAGRIDSDFQKIAGQFTNPVCFVSQFDTLTTFAALLENNKSQLQQALIHQQYPLQQLIEDLNPARTHRNPLFQYAFSWNQMKSQAQGGSLIKNLMNMRQLGSIYDIVLTGFDKGQHIDLQWRYDTALFKVETIERIAQHLINIIDITINDPEKTTNKINFLTQTEKQLIQSVNSTGTSMPQHVIYEFERVVKKYPETSAFTHNQQTVTYKELDNQANQMAHWLQQQGISQQDSVGLILPRGIELLTAILGCLKLNAVYVPIDPRSPIERIQTMITLANCKQVLCDNTQHTQDNETAITIREAIQASKQLSHQSPFTQHTHKFSGNDSACILFTSGTTGQPKGVDIPHRALTRLGLNNGFIDLQAGDRIGYAANVAFDACHIEIWTAFLNGANLVYIDESTLLNPPELLTYLSKQPVDALFLTSALFNLMVNYSADIFSGIKTLMTGGEAMDKHAATTFLNSHNPGQLINLYGPTENGTVSSFQIIDLPHLSKNNIPIGQPINQSQIYVVDQYENHCPIGVVGEIIVGGQGVAKGYINGNLSNAAFIRDHYRNEGLLYRTGDLGFLNEDGQVIYQGRRDEQLKIRGFRVEIGEIEAQISHYPGIKQVAITHQNKGQRGSELHAYFSHNSPIEVKDIKEYLQTRIPSYMMPSAFLQLDQLPLTINGKVDKKSLPIIEQPVQLNGEQPRNTLESSIHQIWMNVLDVDTLSIDDHFFEIGGHSLLAAKCTALIKDELLLPIQIRDIFDRPTVRELSDFFNSNTQNTIDSSVPILIKREDNLPIPAGLSQHRLWFLHQMHPESSAYNMPIALEFQQTLSHQVVEKALTGLIQSHSTLHCHFIDRNGSPYLAINKNISITVPYVDLTTLHPEEKKQACHQHIKNMAEFRFDLSRAPLLAAKLIKRSEMDYLLIIVLHHICIDGLSVNLLLKDLGQRLNTDSLNTPNTQDLDYLDYSLWQQQWLKSTEFNHQLAFWQQYLDTAPLKLNLPTDFPRPIKPTHRGQTVRFLLGNDLTVKLEALAKRTQSSLFNVLMSAYAILLSRYCQQTDICIGFPVSGRQHKATQDMVGLFVNNLVVVSCVDSKFSIQELIRQQKSTLLDVLAHQEVPFDTLIEQRDIDRSLSHTPFLQASIQFETESMEDRITEFMGSNVSLESITTHTAKYDLNLCCTKVTQDLEVVIEFAQDLFKTSSIERMAQHFIRLLKAMTDDESKLIGSIRMITPTEEEQLTQIAHLDKNQNQHLLPNVISCFQIGCESVGSKVAINDKYRQLTYQQLNEKSNQFAHYLLDKGVTAGDFVGIYMDRSANLIITLLAVLKTGAAYVPLDPHSPKDRIAFIIDDAGIKHIISDLDDVPTCKERIQLPELTDVLDTMSSDNPNLYISNASIAYIIYTSGTTGKPKGCLISHLNMTRLFKSAQPVFNFDTNDVWCLFHSYAFDVSVWEIFGALLHGARLAIVPKEIARAPDAFYRFLEKEQVTILNQTPSAFSQLITIDQTQTQLLSLRQIIFAGESLDFSALQPWINNHPLEQVRLTNMYGITETTVHVTYHHVTYTDTLLGQSLIGQPLSDMMIHIVDHHGQLAPVGIMGEICVSGPGVSEGYLGRESLSQERFIHNPFQSGHDDCHHSKLYRSGDLARRLPNGNIEYLGRRDHQVKIRGYRIELGEIESALTQSENVIESRVILSDDKEEKTLIAYCLVQSVHQTLKDRIRNDLKHQLPEYMIPQAIICLDKWPLTPNGKTDILKLPKPSIKDFVTSDYCAPRNETEAILVSIWQDILGLSDIGIYDNFFELGGHSLLATQVNAQIKTHCQSELELQAIFNYPTIAELAIHILEQALNEQALDEDALLAILDEIED